MENRQNSNNFNHMNPLKILIVGNSHGIDSMNLLYEVFRNEAPDKNIVLGRLYYSGCSIRKHAQLDSIYQYTKINDEIYQAGNGWKMMCTNVNMQYGLQDEQWDLVVMQEMNRQAGNADAGTILGSFYQSFNKANYMTVINHIKENVGPDTKLAWNMTWANPNEPQYYEAGNPLTIGGTSENEKKISSTIAWGKDHAMLYPPTAKTPVGRAFDQHYMYQCIVNCVQKYIVDSTEFLGEKHFDMVFPSATAVQYAQEVQGLTQAQIYRDYTHVSDYSRLMVAYLWYAKLMGLNSIDAVNIDTIPAVFGGEKKSCYPLRDAAGVGAIDAAMQQRIKEAVNWALAHPYELPDNNTDS